MLQIIGFKYLPSLFALIHLINAANVEQTINDAILLTNERYLFTNRKILCLFLTNGQRDWNTPYRTVSQSHTIYNGMVILFI
ncbi:hypothetical protein D3C80_1677310 [compost metagenome]